MSEEHKHPKEPLDKEARERLLEAARKDDKNKDGKHENLDEARKDLGLEPLNEHE